MILKIYSQRNDLLQLEVEDNRPILRIGELVEDDDAQAWHAQWQNLVFKKFKQPYELVKGRIKKFYNDENLNDNSNGYAIRKPGRAELISNKETWELADVKIINCVLDNKNKSVTLELNFSGVSYKPLDK